MKACIYKIECQLTQKFYIGSTTLSLKMRLKKHRSSSKEQRKMKSPLYLHFGNVGWQNAEITNIYDVEIECRRHLLEIENKEITKYIGSELCLNHNRSTATIDDKKERDRLYGQIRRQEKKEQERQRVAKWRLENPTKYADQVKRSVEKQRQKRYGEVFSPSS